MDIYEKKSMQEILSGNDYPGRGIVMGMSEDGRNAVICYFITGRSSNSRNRVFVEEGNELVIYPFDESRVEDPSLIIYSPIRESDDRVIVTNGDQTNTVYDYVSRGRSFTEALETRCFEPDGPNWTPRISAMMTFKDGDISYEMSILKSIDGEGSDCVRYHYAYPAKQGLGHFIHTYESDGDPLPTFTGEPKRVKLPDSAEELASEVWSGLDADKRISVYVRYTDTETGERRSVLVNGNCL